MRTAVGYKHPRGKVTHKWMAMLTKSGKHIMWVSPCGLETKLVRPLGGSCECKVCSIE